jgi:hypothetical protein
VAAGFTPIGILGELVSIGTLFAFVIVSIGVLVLRYKQPDLERPFRTPFVPVVPIASALVALLLMAGLPKETWERLIIWMVIGLAIYGGYGYHRSVLQRQLGDRQGAKPLGLVLMGSGAVLGGWVYIETAGAVFWIGGALSLVLIVVGAVNALRKG